MSRHTGHADAARPSTGTRAFEHLFSPITIGPMALKNRVVMAPHGVVFAPGHGSGVDRMIDYHVERAKGGAGLIVMSNFLFLPSWRRLASWGGAIETTSLGTLDRIDDPDLAPAYRRLVDGIHAEGGRFVSQLNASGRQLHAPGVRAHNIPLLAPSPLPCPRTREIPKEMEAADIEEFVEAFAVSAENVAKAGGDGVELFAAQGYLLHSFLSPATNLRTDRFGGDLSGRMRFLLDSLTAVRRRVGRSLAVGVRLNADDRVLGGIDGGMAHEIAARLAATGDVDYLNVSGLTSGAYPGWIADMTAPEGHFAAGAAGLKRAAPGLAVCVASRIPSPEVAEAILASGQADLIGMARALISDPEWPNKALAGRVDDIRRCTYSNQACLMGLDQGRGVGCVHNVAVGRERQLGIGTMRPAARRKRVAVAGGGPAGMAAARIADARGHAVTLFEASDRLGGQNLMTGMIRTRSEFREVTRWQEHMLRQARIEILLDCPATPAALEGFDAVVVATGSTPRRDGRSSYRPGGGPLPGAGEPGVLSVWDVFRNPNSIGDDVVVVDEDPHLSAAYTAEHLADCGKRVTILTPHLHAAPGLHPDHVPDFYRRLLPKGVRVIASTVITAIHPGSLTCSDRFTGEARTLQPVDSVILGMGQVADTALRDQLKGVVAELHVVGDCVSPRLISDAIMDGERAGWML